MVSTAFMIIMIIMVTLIIIMVMVVIMVINHHGHQCSGQVDGEHRIHDPPLQHQLHLNPLLRLAFIHQC